MEIVKKTWGIEQIITNNEKYCGKILFLNQGYKCSYHYHKLKDETFYILNGIVLMNINGKEQVVIPESIIHISPGTKHSFAGLTDAKILEISTRHFDDDSYRESVSGKM